ncbi:MAG TPA: YajQ family cyclic di-GMP-binding protein [Capsulimonadaceae bacterium]
MASEFSFDIVSKPDLQEVKNALQQVDREIGTRYDFKDSMSSVDFDDEKFTLKSDDEFHLSALTDVFRSKLVKRNIDLKFLEFGKIEPATKGTVRQEVTLKNGLPTEAAKKITKLIKDKGIKVTTQIQDAQVRVTSKSKDELQTVMNAVKGADLDVPVQFTNFR